MFYCSVSGTTLQAGFYDEQEIETTKIIKEYLTTSNIEVKDVELSTCYSTKIYTMPSAGILSGYVYANAYQEDNGKRHDFGQLYLKADIYNSAGIKLYSIVDTSGLGSYATAKASYFLQAGDYLSVYTSEGGINTPATINGGFSGFAVLFD